MSDPRLKYDTVIWDWNGTLIDDVRVNLLAVNKMLARRGMPLIDMDRYLDIVEIPIIGAYRKMGFDLDEEAFVEMAAEFGRDYESELSNGGIMENAPEVLAELHSRGIRQTIISSFHQDSLRLMTDHYGITQYFDEILGKNDMLGNRKDDVAKAWLARTGADPKRVVLFGDLTHDWEVAQSIGCDCALIPKGYHKRAALEACGVPVLDDISMVPAFIGLDRR